MTKLKNKVETDLSKLKYKGNPKYHIKIDSKRGQVYVRTTSDRGKGKYLSAGKLANARQIATYDYLSQSLKRIDEELRLLEKAIAFYSKPSPEAYYETLSEPRRKLIVPIRLTDEQFVENWMSEPYERKGFAEDDESEFYTNKNERVRSKSEIIIANELARLNVPYKYECPLYLEGLGVIHPDFTMLNVKQRKILYWEHLGKMDDVDYSRNNIRRINLYQKNGVRIGERLILSMETSITPLDVRLVDSLIAHFLLE